LNVRIDDILKRSIKKERFRDKYFKEFKSYNKDIKQKRDERRMRAI
jgi:hypothetical protein